MKRHATQRALSWPIALPPIHVVATIVLGTATAFRKLGQTIYYDLILEGINLLDALVEIILERYLGGLIQLLAFIILQIYIVLGFYHIGDLPDMIREMLDYMSYNA